MRMAAEKYVHGVRVHFPSAVDELTSYAAHHGKDVIAVIIRRRCNVLERLAVDACIHCFREQFTVVENRWPSVFPVGGGPREIAMIETAHDGVDWVSVGDCTPGIMNLLEHLASGGQIQIGCYSRLSR